MPYLRQKISQAIISFVRNTYTQHISEHDFSIGMTKPDFEGDYSITLFGLAKKLRIPVPTLAASLGEGLRRSDENCFERYELTSAFLNIFITDEYLSLFLSKEAFNPDYGKVPYHGKKVLIEYSSPNTNKPLHLGHLRNNFLGYSLMQLYAYSGYDVQSACVVNDRGVHICKSMYAWLHWGEGRTPQSTHTKGDHFVGSYYVRFATEQKKEAEALIAQGIPPQDVEKHSVLLREVQEMLLKWEQGDTAVRQLWSKMNAWVYEGFAETYHNIGVQFDQTYYESNLYLLGKEQVLKGLKEGVFYQKDDGSVWADLEVYGLDHKLLLRRDGTSVYITQDLALAEVKYEHFKYQESIYVVGDEQNYHFKVLIALLQLLQKPYAKGLYHLSYGMVELPTGKMKSREGTVVDADELIAEMRDIAEIKTKELGKGNALQADELHALSTMIGLAALRFYLLKVDPKKKMVFHPEESIDFQGYTGPFIQYTYARIQSILTKVAIPDQAIYSNQTFSFLPIERQLLLLVEQLPHLYKQALEEHNPSLIANYVFVLSQHFNSFYVQCPILQAPSELVRAQRVLLAQIVQHALYRCACILGFHLPHKM